MVELLPYHSSFVQALPSPQISAKGILLVCLAYLSSGCHLRKYGWGKWADWRKKSQQPFCTDCIHFLWPV
jgi:hypothetical protein